MQELLVINHNQQHGKGKYSSECSSRSRFRSRSRGQNGEHKQDGEETHHLKQIFVPCVWKERKKNGACFLIGFIHLPSERGGGGVALLFCFVPFTPRDLTFWTAAPSQHAGISDRREVAKREENRRERGWKCLSERLNDAICQKHPPHPPQISLPPSLPPAPSDDITSMRSNMAENTCRAACGRWEFFPTAVALLQAVAPATRWKRFQD